MKIKKTILIATGLYPPEIGGPASYSKFLYDELPKQGFEVEVLPFREVRKYPKIIRHFVYFLKVLRVGGGVDVIFAQDPVSVGLPSMLAAKILRKRFILRLGGDYAWEQGVQRYGVVDTLDKFSINYEKYSRKVRIMKIVQLFVANKAERIISPSNYLKKIITNWGVPKEKISVVYSIFTSEDVNGTKEELRNGLRLSKHVIVSAGRLVPWKGFKTLIEIMPTILRKYFDATLLIIGDGPDRKELEELVREKKLNDKVIFLGVLPHQLVLRYIKAGDMFVLNTSYEGMSHFLLEAMSLGTPVITTNVGGNPELIEDGKNGLLVTHDDKEAIGKAIFELFSNKEKAELLAINAKEKTKEFNREKMLEETINILNGKKKV